MYTRLLYTLCLLCFFISVRAQDPGSLDPTFDEDGIQILPVGVANAFGHSMAIQPDGKTVVACIANNGMDTDFAIARFTSAGDPDHSLDGDGIVMTDFDGRTDIAEAIVVDEFDRIVVAGSVDSGDGFGFAAARYLPDGTLDDSFGDQGLVTSRVGITDFCKAVAIQSDNKIVLGGYVLNGFTGKNEFAIMRYHTDGTPDSTFHDDGIVQFSMGIGSGAANAILIQPDGKIVLAGQVLNESTFRWEIGIVRCNADGTLDETWDADGIVFTGSMDADFTIKALALQKDLKIVAGGFFGTAPSNNLFTVARYHTDGRLDESFGEDGIVLGSYGAQDNQINTIVIQPDNHILIAGTSLQGNRDLFAVARLDMVGNFDDTFGEHGVVRPVIGQNDGIHSMALQQDGKLVVAGESFDGQRFSIAVARVETGLTTSSDDLIESSISVSIYPNPVFEQFTLSYKLVQSQSLQIILADINGRLVHTFTDQITQSEGVYRESFELPDGISPGLYWLVINDEDKSRAFKMVISE